MTPIPIRQLARANERLAHVLAHDGGTSLYSPRDLSRAQEDYSHALIDAICQAGFVSYQRSTRDSDGCDAFLRSLDADSPRLPLSVQVKSVHASARGVRLLHNGNLSYQLKWDDFRRLAEGSEFVPTALLLVVLPTQGLDRTHWVRCRGAYTILGHSAYYRPFSRSDLDTAREKMGSPPEKVTIHVPVTNRLDPRSVNRLTAEVARSPATQRAIMWDESADQ